MAFTKNVVATGAIIKALNMAASLLPGVLLFARLETPDYMLLLAIMAISVVLIEAVCIGGSVEAVSAAKKESVYEVVAGRFYISIALIPISLYVLRDSLSAVYLLLISLVPLLTVFSPLLLVQKNKYILLSTLDLFLTLTFLILKIYTLNGIESYVTILFLEYFSKALLIVISNLRTGIFSFLPIKWNSAKYGFGLIFLALISRLEIFYFQDVIDDVLSIYLFLSLPIFAVLYNYKLVYSRVDWADDEAIINDKVLYSVFLVGTGGAALGAMAYKEAYSLATFSGLYLSLSILLLKNLVLVNYLIPLTPDGFLKFSGFLLLVFSLLFSVLDQLELAPLVAISVVNLCYIFWGGVWQKKISQ